VTCYRLYTTLAISITRYTGKAGNAQKHEASNHFKICIQKDNIEVDYKEMRCEDTDWIHLVESNTE
jgi:hypothetical protein